MHDRASPMIAEQSVPAVRHAVDTLSGMAIIASIMGWLTPLAAFLGAVWYSVQIYGWFEKRRNRARSKTSRADDQ